MPKESSSATPNSTKPGKSSNPPFNEASCLQPYKTFSKFFGKSFQLVGQKLRIFYYCNNNDHVLSTRKKGKIRTGQKKVQRANAIIKQNRRQNWGKRVQARTRCNGKETKDGEEENAAANEPCNQDHALHDPTNKRGKTNLITHDHHDQNLKREGSPPEPCHTTTEAKLEGSQAANKSGTKHQVGNELSWSRSIWRTTRPQHKLVFQNVAKSHLKARELRVHSVRETQELGWIETERVRTHIVGRRTKENRECRNRKPRGVVEWRACAHSGHDRGVPKRDSQGKTV